MGVPVGDRWGKTLSRFPKLHAVVAVAGVATLIALVAPTNAAHALEAKSPVERMAFRARVVQSDMMVAALSCGLRNQYNTVVTEFRSELVSHGHVLRSISNVSMVRAARMRSTATSRSWRMTPRSAAIARGQPIVRMPGALSKACSRGA